MSLIRQVCTLHKNSLTMIQGIRLIFTVVVILPVLPFLVVPSVHTHVQLLRAPPAGSPSHLGISGVTNLKVKFLLQLV